MTNSRQGPGGPGAGFQDLAFKAHALFGASVIPG